MTPRTHPRSTDARRDRATRRTERTGLHRRLVRTDLRRLVLALAGAGLAATVTVAAATVPADSPGDGAAHSPADTAAEAPADPAERAEETRPRPVEAGPDSAPAAAELAQTERIEQFLAAVAAAEAERRRVEQLQQFYDAVARAEAERIAAEQAAARRAAERSSSRLGGGFAALRRCESGGDYGAVSSSGTYRGAYQFSRSTWNSVASRNFPHLVGVDPAAASPADQDAMAQALYRSSGSSPWPHCGRHL